MSTKIEWAEETWNPATGCTKISPGCAHCYIERTPPMRMAGRKFVKGTIPIQLHPERLDAPLKWKKPRRIFVNSMSDLFHEDIPEAFITAVFGVMAACPQHAFLVLTKRAQRMRAWGEKMQAAGGLGVYIRSREGRDALRGQFDAVMQSIERPGWTERLQADPWMQVMNGAGCNMGPAPLSNAWLGVTVENQEQTQRIEHLLATPAAVRFLSVEPMLEEVDLTPFLQKTTRHHMAVDVQGALKNRWFDGFTDKGRPLSRGEAELELRGYRNQGIKLLPMGECEGFSSDTGCPGHRNPSIDWVICGGESGPQARPMNPSWAQSLRDQCAEAGVPFFFKQWGEWCYPEQMPEATFAALDAQENLSGNAEYNSLWKVGKKAAGRLLDGREWNEFPKP